MMRIVRAPHHRRRAGHRAGHDAGPIILERAGHLPGDDLARREGEFRPHKNIVRLIDLVHAFGERGEPTRPGFDAAHLGAREAIQHAARDQIHDRKHPVAGLDGVVDHRATGAFLAAHVLASGARMQDEHHAKRLAEGEDRIPGFAVVGRQSGTRLDQARQHRGGEAQGGQALHLGERVPEIPHRQNAAPDEPIQMARQHPVDPVIIDLRRGELRLGILDKECGQGERREDDLGVDPVQLHVEQPPRDFAAAAQVGPAELLPVLAHDRRRPVQRRLAGDLVASHHEPVAVPNFDAHAVGAQRGGKTLGQQIRRLDDVTVSAENK